MSDAIPRTPERADDGRHEFLITIRTPGEPEQHFLLKTPEYHEPGFYRQSVSLSGFQSRELKRIYSPKQWPKKLAWTVKHAVVHHNPSHDATVRYEQSQGRMIPTETIIGVWALYERIGYDRHRKRFL